MNVHDEPGRRLHGSVSAAKRCLTCRDAYQRYRLQYLVDISAQAAALVLFPEREARLADKEECQVAASAGAVEGRSGQRKRSGDIASGRHGLTCYSIQFRCSVDRSGQNIHQQPYHVHGLSCSQTTPVQWSVAVKAVWPDTGFWLLVESISPMVHEWKADQVSGWEKALQAVVLEQ